MTTILTQARTLIAVLGLSLLAGLAQAAPTVSLTTPAANTQYLAPANVTLIATNVTASAGATVTKVEFYAGNTLVGTDTTASPYSIVWANAAAGTYSLTAKVTDSSGATATSSPVNLIVNATNTAPTVSVINSNASYLLPATIGLSANASGIEVNTPISKVDFYANGVLIGTDTTSPYSINWTPTVAGSYSVTAKATDSAGGVTTSAAKTFTLNSSNTPPTVSLTAPAAGASVALPATVTVSATASGVETNTPISKVDFYAGATLIGTATTSPYSIAWSPTVAGTYSLTAKATDSAGGVTTSGARSITVTGGSNAAPTVSLTAPAANTVFTAPATVTLTATAADSDGTIAKVDFYQGATLIGTATAAPYTVTWSNAPAGSYSLTAKATDNKGAVTTSTAIPIIVNALPTVSIISPAANATFTAPATVTVTATAADSDGTIAKVDFYQGATLIGTATAAPYTVTWASAPAGSYSLTAKATDNRGAATTSGTVAITVSGGVAAVYYLYTDHLNTPRLVMDEANTAIWRSQPLTEPFGTTPPEEDPDGNGIPFTLNLRFPGQYYDKETNLSYNYFRDYNSETGRYVESDPIGLKGGINTYSYVGGRPLSMTDPLGLRAGCPTGMKPGESGVCESDPSEPPNSKVCLTGECAADLPPAKNDCRPLGEIEQDQCEMICGWVAPGPPLPMSKKSLGKNAGSWTVCKLLCKNDSFRRFIVRGQ